MQRESERRAAGEVERDELAERRATVADPASVDAAHSELVRRLRYAADIDVPAAALRRLIATLRNAGADRVMICAFLRYAESMIQSGIDEPFQSLSATAALLERVSPRESVRAALQDVKPSQAADPAANYRDRITDGHKELPRLEPSDPVDERDVNGALFEFCALRESHELEVREHPVGRVGVATPVSNDGVWSAKVTGRRAVQLEIRQRCLSWLEPYRPR